ncbi:hypothetical protein P261_02450 [Lachnospiraceae bacterium TWA4]|nr:hypothetical protein P261_02450 [Lachnospiraceae bacterium TWA4]
MIGGLGGHYEKIIPILLTLSICLLTGCGSEPVKNSSTVSNEEENVTSEMVTEEKKSETDAKGTTEIILDFDGEQIEGVLDNSKTSENFLKLLPLTLDMTRFYDREYAAGLGETLSQEGKIIDDFENGDITYYIEGNALAIFFDKADSSDQGGLIRMGKITSDLDKLIQMDGDRKVTISVKEQEKMTQDFKQFSNIIISGVDTENLGEEEREVLYQYARYWQALTDADMEVLDEMIEDNSTFTHMSGRTQTKQEYLADIEDGSLNYTKVEIQNPVMTVEGDTATVNCTTVLTANAYGARGSWPFSGTRSFEKQNGTWKVINR